ncbi:MAG TPA: aminopeptidase P family N-terminal domain-containing protein [Acidimicrobiales bacterium]|nr:aminopeptidase P family N-terminal domain-containing protein [Acidimicrobiales bacterium]
MAGQRAPLDEEQMIPHPRFSLAERDRRWAALRALMAERGLTAIVTPAHTGHSLDFQANSRYLSHCGGGEGAEITVIFPLDGEVTVGATSAAERWPRAQNWVTDIREARRDYGKVAVERLHELGVTDDRVGITGLGTGTRSPEGTVLYHTMLALQQAFPAATFEDATDLLDEVRLTKSEEEIEFLRRRR